MHVASEIYVGVDIGGTKVAAGLVNGSGEILYKTRTAMKTDGSADEATACVFDAIDRVLADNKGTKVSAIGLVSPGFIDVQRGTVMMASNLPCWRDYGLQAVVASRYGMVTRLHNDANAAGLAEAIWGAGKGFRCLFYASLGTGIGTAITYNARLYLGRTGVAGEGGHMSIDYHGPKCPCGKSGCIEVLTAGPAIAQRGRAKLANQPERKSVLRDVAKGDLSRVTSEEIAAAWRAGDELATEVLQETADLLSIWLGNMIDLLEPDAIVMGGGVSSLIADWFPRIHRQLADWSINPRCNEIPILQAHYKADAGVVGGAAVCAAPDAHL